MGKAAAAGKLKLLFMAGIAVELPNWNTPAEGFGCAGVAEEAEPAAPKLKLGVVLNPEMDCCGWVPNIEEEPKPPVPKGVGLGAGAPAAGTELPNGVAFKSPNGVAEDAVVVDPNVKGAGV